MREKIINQSNFMLRLKHKDGSVIHQRRSLSEKICFIIAFAIFIVYAFTIIFYFGWAFKCSLMTLDEFFDNPMAFPKQLMIENYLSAFNELTDPNSGTDFFGMLINSLWYSFGVTLIAVFMHAITGYVFAKYDFFAKKFLMNVAIFTMIIPIVGSLPSSYSLICGILRINNSPLLLITSLGGFGGNFLILLAVYRGVDSAYSEAAFIDGASDYTVFFKIMLPMAKGPLFAIGVLTFIGCWNDYNTAILYLDEMPTIASGLYTFKEQMTYVANDPVYFSGVILAMIPPLVLFCIFSEKIMGSVVVGGLKG